MLISDEPFSCPTFNSYTTDQLAEIGKNVADEFMRENLHHHDDGFEFDKLLEILDHEIGGPVVPIFDQIIHNELPLKNLCIEDRETVSSSSDSEEVVPPESFCIWMPKFGNSSSAGTPASCRKSKSTGSASTRRFRIRDLLRRSNSEGKDSFVFLTPKNNHNNNKNVKVVAKQQSGGVGKVAGKSRKEATAHEKFYVANTSVKEGKKRKSYLPYRKNIVEFFGEVDSFDMRKKLRVFCVGLLLQLLKKKHRVYLTCNTGFDCSPSCVIDKQILCLSREGNSCDCIAALDDGYLPSCSLQFSYRITLMQAPSYDQTSVRIACSVPDCPGFSNQHTLILFP